MCTDNNPFIRSFKKIIPSLRKDTRSILEQSDLTGERFIVPLNHREIEVFWHRADKGNAPVLFELHGGGFALGDARKNDQIREYIKNSLNIHVIGINYRKAPENPYPDALNDVIDILKYYSEHAGAFQMDRRRFALMGFSAGANLAVAAAMKVKGNQDFHIICEVLHYPFLDAKTNPQDKKGDKGELPDEIMDAFNELYAKKQDRGLPEVSPVYASKELLSGMPETMIFTAQNDALCAEGFLYSEKLKEAGVPVSYDMIKDAHHGYIEDAFQDDCYNSTPKETRELHSKRFKEAAKEAIDLTILRLIELLGNGE